MVVSPASHFMVASLLGAEDRSSLRRAVRGDGVIVKPDVPCVPLDQCHIADATNQSFKILLPPPGAGFYMMAPRNRAGMAFFGDAGKFVATGRQRISQFKMEAAKLTATVHFAPSEKLVELHGRAPAEPAVTVWNGTAGPVKFDPITGHYTVAMSKDEPVRLAGGANAVRTVRVEISAGRPGQNGKVTEKARVGPAESPNLTDLEQLYADENL